MSLKDSLSERLQGQIRGQVSVCRAWNALPNKWRYLLVFLEQTWTPGCMRSWNQVLTVSCKGLLKLETDSQDERSWVRGTSSTFHCVWCIVLPVCFHDSWCVVLPVYYMMHGVLYFWYLQYLAMVCGSLKRPPRKSDHCRCSRRLWVRGTSQTKRCHHPHLQHSKVSSWILKFRLWTLEILPWSRSCRTSVEHLPNVDWLVSMVFEVLQAVGQSLWAENIWEKGFCSKVLLLDHSYLREGGEVATDESKPGF